MAEVWRARRIGPGGFERVVAIKRMLPHVAGDGRLRKLFQREAAIWGALHHRNIVTVFELGESDGELYLVMELVDGVDVRTVCRAASVQKERLPLGFALHVARELCVALAYAHELTASDGRPLGVVHRDVSASNVLIGYDGAVKLTDFGVAKIVAEATAATQSNVRGNLAYMPPEQAEGGRIDRRADVFSTGVLLYEMTTGHRPFLSSDGSLALLRGEIVPSPSALVPGLPPELDAVCARCLEVDAAKRFPDCRALEAAIAPLAEAHPFGAVAAAELVKRLVPPAPPGPVTAPTEEGTAPPSASSSSSMRRLGAWVAGTVGVALLVVAGAVIARERRTPPPPPTAPPSQPAPAPAPLSAPDLQPAPVVATPPPPPERIAPPPKKQRATRPPHTREEPPRRTLDPLERELRDPFSR
jgi:serine/threonine-protein kinase